MIINIKGSFHTKYQQLKEDHLKKYGEEFPTWVLPTADMGSSMTDNPSEADALYWYYMADWCEHAFHINREFTSSHGFEVKHSFPEFYRVYTLSAGNGRVGAVFFSLPQLLVTLHEIEQLYGSEDKPLELKEQDRNTIVYYSPHRGHNWIIEGLLANTIPGY
jgi:hypothetical protein